MVVEKITDLLEEKFSEEAFSDCFLVDINHSNKKLEVFIDSDSGINFEKCQKISRYLEQFLDEEGWLGEEYVLEVSSPGVGRPLKLKRQYPKNIGRKVEVFLREGETTEGVLTAVDEEGITLEAKVRRKEGKRKKTETVERIIPFTAIKKTVVKVSF